MKDHPLYPEATKEISEKRTALAPKISEAFRNFSKVVFEEGALSEKTKQIIAVAVAHVTQSYCAGQTERRKRAGDHGGNLGGCRDASRGFLRSFNISD